MATKPKRPSDPNQLAKLIVDIATGETPDDSTNAADEGKDTAAVALGRKGGLKGGQARTGALTPEKRPEIAKKAAKARWNPVHSIENSSAGPVVLFCDLLRF